MAFKIAFNETGQLVLKRQGFGCAMAFVIFIGIIFLLVGSGLLFFGERMEMPFAIMRFVVPGMGVIAIIIGATMPAGMKKRTPDAILFDNANGRVEVQQASGEIHSAYIYYDEIAGFTARVVSRSSGSGSRSNSYGVYLVKKDGGDWQLTQSMSMAGAENDLMQLRQYIQLQNTPVKMKLAVPQTSRLSVKNTYAETEIEWRNAVGTRPLVFALLFAFVGSIMFMFFGAMKDSGGFAIFGGIFAGFIGLLFFGVIFFYFMKMIKDMKTVYAVRITRNAFHYLEKDKQGNEKKNDQIALREIGSVAYSFVSNVKESKIFVYTKEQAMRKADLGADVSLQNLKDWFEFHKGLLAFNINDLTPVETLVIENYLQQAIREKGHGEVL